MTKNKFVIRFYQKKKKKSETPTGANGVETDLNFPDILEIIYSLCLNVMYVPT